MTRGHGGVDRGGGGARGHYRVLGDLERGHDDSLGAVIPGLVWVSGSGQWVSNDTLLIQIPDVRLLHCGKHRRDL